jgi:hypothetical protein
MAAVRASFLALPATLPGQLTSNRLAEQPAFVVPPVSSHAEKRLKGDQTIWSPQGD